MFRWILCFFLLFLAIVPSTASAQSNLLHCYFDSTTTCVVDLSVQPNPDCNSTHQAPSCLPDQNCCLAQMHQNPGSCNNVPCVPLGSTPTNTPDPSPTPDTSTACGMSGYFCRPTTSNNSGCNWNETPISVNCTGLTNHTCCNPIPPSGILTCGVSSGIADGTCQASCVPGTTPYSGVNNCMASSQSCCLPVFGPEDDIFCDTAQGRFTGVKTALGCLPYNVKPAVNVILGWAVGISGGVAFLVLVYGGILMATATGDPKRVKAAQELITASLAGLALIVTGVVVLNFAGYTVLGLPSFVGNPNI